MSADCLVVLRKTTDMNRLQSIVSNLVEKTEFGIWYSPSNALLYFKQVILGESDFCFSPTDSPSTTNVDLLISHENYYIDGQCARLPLKDRLMFVQVLVESCLHFAESVEVYISEDNPYLPEYTVYSIPCSSFTEVVINEYQRYASTNEMIPSIAIFCKRG